MKNKNSKKIIGIAIVLVIILISTLSLAYVYFATNIFKSDKEMFFSYLSQMLNVEDLNNKALLEYVDKKETRPYTNEGSFSVNVSGSSNVNLDTRSLNNTRINFSGQIDKSSSKIIQDISVDYSNSVKLPFTYKKINETIGIQSRYIGSKYIATRESDSVDSLAGVLEILDKIEEAMSSQINEKDMLEIQASYFKILNQELQSSNFSKIETADSMGYKLSLEGADLKNLLVKLLENLKNDQIILGKINEYMTIQDEMTMIVQNDIDMLIEEIVDNQELDDEKIEITVYGGNRQANKILVEMNKFKLEIEETRTADDIVAIINLEIKEENSFITKISLKLNYKGLSSAVSVNESYELGIDFDIQGEKVSYTYNLNNNINFVGSSNIEEFTTNNALFLDELEQEQSSNLVNTIMNRIETVNNEQMDELGLDENPLIDIIPLRLLIGNISMGAINNSSMFMSEAEIRTFNEKFENYRSTNLQGTSVRGLLQTIEISNEVNSSSRQIEEIHFDGDEYFRINSNTIEEIREEIETDTIYRVDFEKNFDTGLINRVVINRR